MSAEPPRTIAQARRALTVSLAAAGIDTADADARVLIAHALDIDRATLLTHGHRVLTPDEDARLETLAARRLKHEPVAYITGRREFWSLPLIVTPDVLIPRPDTETVVELALDLVLNDGLRLEKLRILDIGTGSGAILLALLSELENATGTGTDLSVAALATARSNAEMNGFAGRCRFIACDLAAGLAGPFDLIVSNPPYIARGEIAGLAPDVRDHEPALALDGGHDGLDFYRTIAAQAGPLLAPGGRLVVELGAGQEPAVRTLFADAGLKPGEARKDFAGIARALPVFPS